MNLLNKTLVMKNKIMPVLKNKFIITIISLILLGTTFGLGYFLGQRKFSTLLTKETIINLFGSVQGKVVEIVGRKLTLKKGDSISTVLIKENATVEQFKFSETGELLAREEKKFNEIKVGDEISVIVKISPNMVLEGERVMILKSSGN